MLPFFLQSIEMTGNSCSKNLVAVLLNVPKLGTSIRMLIAYLVHLLVDLETDYSACL